MIGGNFINTLGILSLLAAMFYLWLGIFGFYLYTQGRINKLFLGISLCLAWWSFAYGFFYAAPDKTAAWFWFRLSSPGWILLPAFLLLFGLEVARKLKLMKKYIIGLIFLWPAIELYRAITGVLTAEDFGFKPYGTVEVISLTNPWYWLHMLYYILYVGLMFLIIYRWGRRSPLKREKMQSLLIILFGLVILLSGIFTNLVMPALSRGFLGVAHFFGIVWAAGFLYAVARYRFMRFDYKQILENVLANINDVVFILGYDLRILQVNYRAEKLLGLSREDINGTPFGDWLEKEEDKERLFTRITERSFLHMPLTLVGKGGRRIITRSFINAIKDDFGDIIVITVVSQDIRLITRLRREIKIRREKEKELKYLSFHDPLTGLFNRTYFVEWMRKLDEEKKTRVGLIICDLDGLKEINDRLGHLKGDEYIKRAADVLRRCVREKDEVMRIGGDEFAVLLFDVDEEVVRKVALRIREVFACEGKEMGDVCAAGISAGYAYRSDADISAEELFRQADLNMYEDKYKKEVRSDRNA
ncbi:PAS domain S-box-containing protein/diguanylate cyclase (GGDEF) domain-containing protein [Thermosyntropha lipolytica DSM 11003]|uniref:PAS domain S-box-containing protein/diguanylate cyclase (GGDEF) domain-containing protein n=1 Tax=Thermosyntropha lipolytica DSM 11003 TaxID=1123382 RepID=A0A1M5LX89_9FIRM|nr:diguanylate cyclase [Thermosyntropha lipolytica]SHG68993.1 PAS domain S-box-containing protein/diguanylate cyclase (GGDEF) domain-containing protein [Thermosyntropha lipolytica DSM 11003]